MNRMLLPGLGWAILSILFIRSTLPTELLASDHGEIELGKTQSSANGRTERGQRVGIERLHGVAVGPPPLHERIANLGRLALQAGQMDEAYGLIAEAVALVRTHRNYKGLADWLVRLGEVESYKGNAAHLHECLQLFTDMSEPRGQADVQAGLAYLALRTEGTPGAVQHIRQSLGLYRTLYEKADRARFDERFVGPEFVDALLRAGLVAAAAAQPMVAATFFGAVAQLSARINHTPVPPLQRALEDAIAQTRQPLGAGFQATWDSGQTLPLDEVLALTIELPNG